MDRILLQLIRLRRHYRTVVNVYDRISLLDLSHSLRICTELKEPLKVNYPDFAGKKLFKTAMPSRRLLKTARGHESVFIYMPNGVKTYANNGDLLSGIDGKVNIALSMRPSTEHLELKHFVLIEGRFRDLSSEDIRRLANSENTKTCTFSHWLGAEAVRGAYVNEQGNLEQFAISREMVIKRVANTLDGSHHSSAEDGSKENKYNAPINYLLKYNLGGLPLPYFILLKIAQDIVKESDNIPGINDHDA